MIVVSCAGPLQSSGQIPPLLDFVLPRDAGVRELNSLVACHSNRVRVAPRIPSASTGTIYFLRSITTGVWRGIRWAESSGWKYPQTIHLYPSSLPVDSGTRTIVPPHGHHLNHGRLSAVTLRPPAAAYL